MENLNDFDFQSMDIDVIVSPHGTARSTAAKSVGAHQASKRDCHSVIEISDSSANTPLKSQRKNRPAASNIEIASGGATSSYAQVLKQPAAKSASGAFQKKAVTSPLCINLGRTAVETPIAQTPTLVNRKAPTPSDPSTLPLLHIVDLSEICPRFAIEGKVLNNYGTFKLKVEEAKFPRYFKADIVDVQNSNTVTLVVEESLLVQFETKFAVGSYVRIEGASVRKKSRVDGGTCMYSLNVDSASIISEAAPFPITLSFYPEQKIRGFLNEAHLLHTRGAKQHLGTLAFVVIQADNLEGKTGGTRGELLIADGPTLADRATLTFVNDRKDEYANIVNSIERDSIVMFVARNIGAFMSRDNSLSILDLTILLSIESLKLRKDLIEIYEQHMEFLGYGKEVHGELAFTKINSVLLEVTCYVCKSAKVHKTFDGFYCVSCSKPTRALEIPRLHAKIQVGKESTIHTQLIGHIVDKVLHLKKPFKQLYSKSVIGVREILACNTRRGIFKLDRAGNVCDYTELSR